MVGTGGFIMKEEQYAHLTQLGRDAPRPSSPEEAELEWMVNPAIGKDYVIRLTCPEFTSLCPLTGQPDFAHLVIDYIPNERIVESKSFKLFLSSYRNHKTFHEACTMEISGRLISSLDPVWLRIGAYWYPRGGIPIDIFWQNGSPPAGAWIPSQDVPPYRGR
jgi:7-cyano-7-deazaguanine reductase